jgi:hypothetical protein
MNMLDDLVATEMDEILRRSALRAQQHRIRIAELTSQHAIRAEGVLSEMLASIGRLTEYRAKYSRGKICAWDVRRGTQPPALTGDPAKRPQ